MNPDLDMNDPEVDELLQKWERCDRIIGIFLCVAALVAITALVVLLT